MSELAARRSRRPLPVGIVGAGYFGGVHANAIAATDGLAKVVAVASSSLASASALANDGARAYDSWERLIDDPEVAAVCICTPHHLHLPVALASARAGKAVMLEKPMAMTLAECDELVDAATTVPLMVAHPSRFIPAYVLARRLIDEGRVGHVVYVRAPMIKDWQLTHRKPWHLDSERGGGMWMVNGIHLVDRLCWLFDGMPRSASAAIGTCIHPGMRVDDVAIATFDFGEGRTGVAEAVAYANGAPMHETLVIGTKGILRCEHHDGVHLGAGEAWTFVGGRSTSWRDPAILEEWRAFVAHVEGAPSPVSAQEARSQMAAVLGARQAATTAKVVMLST